MIRDVHFVCPGVTAAVIEQMHLPVKASHCKVGLRLEEIRDDAPCCGWPLRLFSKEVYMEALFAGVPTREKCHG